MERTEFQGLFERALQIAADRAEARLGRPIPRAFRVRLHGAGHGGDLLRPQAAAEALYLGQERSNRIIDVAVTGVTRERTTVFVGASTHTPGGWDETWNKPEGMGPFKQIEAAHIVVDSESPQAGPATE